MTDQPPSGGAARRARPSAGMRRTMLGQDEIGLDDSGRTRGSLADALAAIPDIEREPVTVGGPASDPIPSEHVGWSGNGAAPATSTDEGGGVLAPPRPDSSEPEADDLPRVAPPSSAPSTRQPPDQPTLMTGRRRRHRRRVAAPRRHVPWYRRLLFALALIALILAIPVLGWLGVKLIRDSTGGTYLTSVTDKNAPGYQALVEPTPTALFIQKGADGTPVALTFVALGDPAGGGSVELVPLDTRVASLQQGVHRLRDTYRPSGTATDADKALSDATAKILGVGVGETISLDDAAWQQLLTKVAPITIQNPDNVTAGFARFPAGRIQLQANQIGPYLSARLFGESDLNRLNRQELVWRAIIDKLAAAKGQTDVGARTGGGAGRYLDQLGKGTVSVGTLPVRLDPNGQTFTADTSGIREQMLMAVPYPQSPGPGARPSIRVLNGVRADPTGTDLTRAVVNASGVVTAVGNAPKFGQSTTVFEYADPRMAIWANYLRALLGGKGRLVHNPRALDSVDMTITFGKDLVDQIQSSTTTASSSTVSTSSTAAGG